MKKSTKSFYLVDVQEREKGLLVYLHTKVLPAVDPGFEHWGVRGEPSL